MKKITALITAIALSGCASMTEQERKRLTIALGAIAVGAAAYSIARNGGGYSSAPYADWDEFYDRFGNSVWQCRAVATGQFIDNQNCAGLIQIDSRWPSKRAW